MFKLTTTSVPHRLYDVTLALAKGDFVCVVGENGAGKSTLLSLLAGLTAAGAGSIDLDDQALSTWPHKQRALRISSLGQLEADVDTLLCAKRIAIGTHATGLHASAAAVAAVAAELSLSHLLNRQMQTLSGGERRRAAVARALVHASADAYVLDEPYAGIDLARHGELTTALRARAAAGKLVVASVHDVGVALTADRVVGLRGGRVVFDGPSSAFGATALFAIFGVHTLPGTGLERERE